MSQLFTLCDQSIRKNIYTYIFIEVYELIYVQKVSLYPFICEKLKVLVTQSCPGLCDSMNYTFLHVILQARILQWVAIHFSRGSS